MDKTKLNKHFILASNSKRRLELLSQIGVKPDLILSPNIDETIFYKEHPQKYVKRMSLEKNRVFLMIVNRFMWEDIEKGISRQNKRIKCAIKFEGILKVKSKKINQENRNRCLECLAIKCNENINKNYEINFFFSGGGVITLISEYIQVVMHDLGLSWDVKHIPKHKI